MEKGKQVVSPELAKEMAVLGFEQDSLFWWDLIDGEWKLLYKPLYKRGYAAYTVAELGDMLPNNDEKNGEYVTIKTGGGKWLAWEIQNGLYNGEGSFIVADIEADARAQMCIILRNTGLL